MGMGMGMGVAVGVGAGGVVVGVWARVAVGRGRGVGGSAGVGWASVVVACTVAGMSSVGCAVRVGAKAVGMSSGTASCPRQAASTQILTNSRTANANLTLTSITRSAPSSRRVGTCDSGPALVIPARREHVATPLAKHGITVGYV